MHKVELFLFEHLFLWSMGFKFASNDDVGAGQICIDSIAIVCPGRRFDEFWWHLRAPV